MCVWTGKAKTKEARQTIINPDWNFEKMGIGGLDKEFSDIFRRAFASRVFPPDIVEQMGERPPSVILLWFYIFSRWQIAVWTIISHARSITVLLLASRPFY